MIEINTAMQKMKKLKDILMHTREGAERITGLDILCMLGLV